MGKDWLRLGLTGIVTGVLLFFTFKYLFSWFAPLLLGVAIAALLRPAALRLHQRTGLSEKASARVVLLGFYLVVSCLIALFFTIILSQLYDLLERFPTLYAQTAKPMLTRFREGFLSLAARCFPEAGAGIERFYAAVSQAAQQAAVDCSAHLVSWAAALAARLPILLLAAVFTVAISMLVGVNYHQVGAALRALFPAKAQKRIDDLQIFLRDTIWQYIQAYTILTAITFVELVAGLWLLRFQYVLPVAVFIALVDLLPLIGSGMVLVPWGLFLLAGGDYPGGWGLLALFGIMTILRNLLEPRIVGAQLGLNPIVSITAMYAGLRAAGLLGMICAPVLVLLARYFLLQCDDTP